MAMQSRHLAIDLGAESGRAVLGTLADGKLEMTEIHRFANKMLPLRGHLHWDVYQLYENILQALALAPGDIQSIGIDTWGVDFGILDRNGNLMGLPFAYRDDRHPEAMAAFLRQMPADRLYSLTGTELLPFNTLFQLEACRNEDLAWLEDGADLLFLPDLLAYLLTGVKKTEFSFASTSQLMDPRTGQWETSLLQAVGVSPSMMQPVVPAGTLLGELSADVVKATGGHLAGVPVVAVASHDTACAVAAVPAEGSGWAFISSGTWSIMGVESDQPTINEATFKAGFTNEGSASGNILLMKNIIGLWIVQGLRKAWSREGDDVTYAQMAEMASQAKPFAALVDPDQPTFLNPDDMVAAYRQECRRTGQTPPETRADMLKSVLESISFKYRYVRDQLIAVGKGPIERLHIIGGGSQNHVLCQCTADALGVPVIAGPAEGTAAGNLLIQAVALGALPGFDSIREVVRRSVQLETYEPENTPAWDAQYSRFLSIVEE